MDWTDDLDLQDAITAVILGTVEATKSEKIPAHIGQPGHQYPEELLQGSPKRIYEVLRMKRETFFDLCTWLEENTQFRSYN